MGGIHDQQGVCIVRQEAVNPDIQHTTHKYLEFTTHMYVYIDYIGYIRRTVERR